MKMSTSNVPQYSLLVCLEDRIRSIGFVVGLRAVVSYLPASDSEKESQDIGLLLLLKLLDCSASQISIASSAKNWEASKRHATVIGRLQ